jgi:hypothetical protein
MLPVTSSLYSEIKTNGDARAMHQRRKIPTTKVVGMRKIENFKSVGFGNWKMKRSQIRIAQASACIAAVTICLSYSNSELVYENEYQSDLSINIIRAIIMILSGIQCILSYNYHKNQLKTLISYKLASNKCQTNSDSLFQNSTILSKLLLDLLLSISFAPPGLDWSTSFFQLGKRMHLSLDDILFPITCFRVIHFTKLLYEYSSFNDTQSAFHW